MNTDQMISHARARFDHSVAKRVLKEKYQAKMTFAHAGGMWQAGPELLATLKFCTPDREIVLLDLYENPVKINTKELWNMAAERWQEVMNAWLVEYEELNKKR
jgi:hypothetical protein